MLIKSLCDYHDMMVDKNLSAPPGYEKIGITYAINLNPDGTISSIQDCREKESFIDSKGKQKSKITIPEKIFPKRQSVSTVRSESIEHRSKYIFGLAFESGNLCKFESKNGKKQDTLKCFEKFKDYNLKFIEGIDSPVVNAYRNFILNWEPEKELKNEFLLPLGKKLNGAYFEFRLAGDVKVPPLQEDEQIKYRWETQYFNKGENLSDKDGVQCGIYGEKEEIAKTHNKIKGIFGGQPSGCVLVCFNNHSENSYGKEKAFNSNVSVKAMRKYTEALNYIIKKNRMIIDDTNIVYWSCDRNSGEKCEEIFDDFCECKFDSGVESAEIEKYLKKLVSEAQKGKINFDKISDDIVSEINENSDFYIVGLKPNESRIAIKFFYKNKFGKLMYNIAKYQSDMQISTEEKLVPLLEIKSAIVSEKSKNSEFGSEFMSRIFKAIVCGGRYPELLLNTAITKFKLARLKNDDKYSSNQELRAGLIKACLIRKLKKQEEFKMSLDLDNKNAAYLCGRLFAVLEKVQQDSAAGKLNRTIKDSYFSSACSRPSSIFPQLLKLSNHHLAKLDDKIKVYYNKLISSIVDDINGEFSSHLHINDQGRFILGYFQQNRDLYRSKSQTKSNDLVDKYIDENEEEI